MVPFKSNRTKTGDQGPPAAKGEKVKTPVSGLKGFFQKLYKILKGEKIKAKP